jgi:hypothetical protein
MNECSKCGGDDIAMILWGLPNMSSELEKKSKIRKLFLEDAVSVAMSQPLNAMTADGGTRNDHA